MRGGGVLGSGHSKGDRGKKKQMRQMDKQADR